MIFGIIKLIMWLAPPLAAFGGMAYTVAVFGASSLKNLGTLMITFWVVCAIFVFVVLGAVSAWAGFSILKVIRLIKDELLIILGTSSSESVLPRLLTKLESAGGVAPDRRPGHPDRLLVQPRRHLHLPDAGRAVHHPGGQRDAADRRADRLALLMVLTSKGAAGITGAGLVTLAASLQAFGGGSSSPPRPSPSASR